MIYSIAVIILGVITPQQCFIFSILLWIYSLLNVCSYNLQKIMKHNIGIVGTRKIKQFTEIIDHSTDVQENHWSVFSPQSYIRFCLYVTLHRSHHLSTSTLATSINLFALGSSLTTCLTIVKAAARK